MKSFSNFLLSCCLLLLVIGVVPKSGIADETANGEKTESPFFKACTYNIRLATASDGEDAWPHRADRVIEFLREWDVFGLQEVTPVQLSELDENLDEDYGWYGLGRDDGKRKGEHAPIFYRKDRFELVKQSTIWLCEKPDEPGKMGWDAACPRTLTWVLLRDLKSDTGFIVANTHFDHMGVVARNESAKLIVNTIKEIAGDLPVIIMGDFNCLPGSDPYKEIAESYDDARLVAKTKVAEPSGTWCGFKEIIPNRIIDHVFVNPTAKVLHFEILNPKTEAGRFASDHLPVGVTVELMRKDSTADSPK